MINAILIPAESTKPLRLLQVNETDAASYRNLVGDTLQVLGLGRPAASMYVDELGKRNRLATNLRATALLWVHNPAFRDQDHIVGPALVVGPPTPSGYDQSIPNELGDLLTRVPAFEIQTRPFGERRWWTYFAPFSDWLSAYTEAINMARRLGPFTEVRVVPADHVGLGRVSG